MNLLDLSQLPVPDVIETIDFEEQFQNQLQRFRDAMGDQWTAQLESEPVIMDLETTAYEIVTLRARVNAAARAVLLASSTGNDLDGVLALLNAKRLDGEKDASFKERGRLAPYGYSTAGPLNAYKYHARSAHDDVLDAGVSSPEPGVIRVTVLSRLGDGTPSAEVLAAVVAALNAEDVRPLNDTVLVVPAIPLSWSLVAQLTFESGAAHEPALAAAQAAAEAYAVAQQRLGKPIRRNMVIAALGVEGVQNVELPSLLEDIEPQEQGAPFCTGIQLTAVVGYE